MIYFSVFSGKKREGFFSNPRLSEKTEKQGGGTILINNSSTKNFNRNLSPNFYNTYMKVCSSCRQFKPFELFYKNRKSKDGFMSPCKECHNEINKKSKSKPESIKKTLEYRESRKEYIKEYKRKRKQENKEEFNEKRRLLRKTCPKTKIFRSIEKRLHKLKVGTYSVAKLTGCSQSFLKEYLESLWKEGMSWENYGGSAKSPQESWEIDHIKPCSSFDLSDPEQQKQCFHYSNLQPLWRWENLLKGSKY